MTQPYGHSTAPDARQSTPEVARDEAMDVARTAADRGGDVAGTVGEQAGQVASETKRQARNLLHEGRDQLNSQARHGQQRAAEGLHTLATQLEQMSDRADDKGVAADVARQVADRTRGVASWLERREPGDLVDEVRRFARRKPGVFLLGAALAGVAVGRLTRGAVAANSDDSGTAQRQGGAPATSGTYGGGPTRAPAYSTPPVPPGPPVPPAPSGPPLPAAPPVWGQQGGPANP